MTPVTEFMNVKAFTWTLEVVAAFEVIKKHLTSALFLPFHTLSCSKLFVMLVKLVWAQH